MQCPMLEIPAHTAIRQMINSWQNMTDFLIFFLHRSIMELKGIHEEKEEEQKQMLKQATFAILIRALAVISLTESTTAKVWATSFHSTTQCLHQSQPSCNPVTLSEVQDHSSWYQTGQFNVFWIHTKFKRNWLISV